MRKPNREINIFSMSALDLFASALGAFILISVVLFPYFPNIGNTPANITALRAGLEETRQQLRVCQTDLTQTRAQLTQTQMELAQTRAELRESPDSLRRVQEELQQCTAELRKKFVLILMSWRSMDDIDLHVIDPQNNEFYYDKRSHSGTLAKFEEDNILGPGNEIWLHPQATPGEYKIYYSFYRRRSRSAVKVRGSMLTPDGRAPIPDMTLTRQGQKKLAAVVVVNNDGEASLQSR